MVGGREDKIRGRLHGARIVVALGSSYLSDGIILALEPKAALRM